MSWYDYVNYLLNLGMPSNTIVYDLLKCLPPTRRHS